MIYSLLYQSRLFLKWIKIRHLGTGFAFVSLYIFYKMISTPPKNLRHIPSINYFQMMKYFIFSKKPLSEIIKKTVDPILDKKGLYLKPSRSAWSVCIADPELAKIVLRKNDIFPKFDISSSNRNTLNGKFSVRSNNLFFSTGKEWKKQRRISNPAFQKSMTFNLFGAKGTELITFISNNFSGEEFEVDMGNLMKRLALDTIGVFGFDFEFNSISNPENEYVSKYNKVMDGLIDPIYFFFPKIEKNYLWLLPKRKNLHEELDLLLNNIQNIITKRRELLKTNQDVTKNSSEKDILTLLIESTENTSEEEADAVASDDFLLSNLCVYFSAGHGTTSAGLTFAIYEMAVNQEVQEKARDEAIRILGNNNENTLPTAEQVLEMDYISLVIKETLRLHPPAPICSSRYATEDCILGDTAIPKGSVLVVDLLSINRNPRYWENPDKFYPERFLDNKRFGDIYFPFGNGARTCIGQKFSVNQQKVFLSMFLKKYTWSLPSDSIHKNGLITSGIFLLEPFNTRIILKPRY